MSRRLVVPDAEMAIFAGGKPMKRTVPCVLVMDVPDDLLIALHTGQRPGVASTAAAVPRPPVHGAAAVDGATAETDRTNDDGAGVRPDAVSTA